MGELRESKKRETRQRISDVATGLFFERGFDAVTIDEIALGANVSKMTVFNYFPRKEDLLLDREDDLKLAPFREAVRNRPDGQSPVDAIRALLRTMSSEKHPLCYIGPPALDWWRVLASSASLQARLRELSDEGAEALAIELGGAKPDGRSRLMAGLIALTLRTAREETVRMMARGVSAKKANAAFLVLMEQGLTAVETLETLPLQADC
ncbi:TetR/AcrR family transcriptional regulator [Mitsuaria sp. 7]|uniref:TetR/AcrR family transcriptional regulator n=1 Tax=Mitsuaria sp. 7 TaxID=1658665 RepID=UPI0007DDF772|nr:TetR family transcriptional regulator [Mitsuaria sp. 7]ANH69168.1 BetI family transcriptional regulator [Mitsuaria sp. 7]